MNNNNSTYFRNNLENELNINDMVWKSYKLSDLGYISRGKSRHRPRYAEHLYGGPYPFIQTGEIKAANHKITNYTQTYSEAGLMQSKLWPQDTLCITIAANIAETAILSFPACFPDSVIGFIADPEKCDIDFIEYLLQFYKSQIRAHSIGTVQENINLGTFDRIKFPIPDVTEQKAIARILLSLDEKLENNIKMNETLEQIARAIFKRWFIDFEFPDENGNPYKSSGGEMVESDLEEIPRGWIVKDISQIGKIICGKTPSKAESKYYDSYMPFIKIPDMHNSVYIIKTEDNLSKLGAESQGNKTLPPNSICVSCIATVGLVSITSTFSQTNQQINSIVPNKEYYTYYLFFRMKSLKNEFNLLASGGTTTKNLNTREFSQYRLLMPSDKLLNTFNGLVEPLFKQILMNTINIESLVDLRDSLLPKLMTGKIRVPQDI